MNIQTNFNEVTKEKLKSLVGNKLNGIIFFQSNPNIPFHFSTNFPSRNQPFICRGAQLALVFEMPRIVEGTRKKRVRKVLSIEANNHDRDNRIINNKHGGVIWNLDFYFDSENYEGALITKIGKVDLYEKQGRRVKLSNSHVKMGGGKQNVKKIEVFGMKEYFEDIAQVDFENMNCYHPGSYEGFNPFDINISTIVVLSLSDDTYIVINGRSGLRVIFLNKEEMDKQYEYMSERKNTFMRPLHTLIYSIEAPS